MEAGSRLGPYEMLSRLGAGGMGEVWKAKDSRLGRFVAVKLLKGSNDQDARRRLVREAQIASKLTHPNVCTLHDVGTERDVDYLVMELLEGETLLDRLATGPLPQDDALRIGREIAAALAHAHGLGFVHRDLKPSNVFLTAAGTKLLDFGLARPAPLAAGGDALGPRDGLGPDDAGDGPRHGRLHVSRAGPRRAGRQPVGRLLLRDRSVRDAFRAAGFPRRHGRRVSPRDPEEPAPPARPPHRVGRSRVAPRTLSCERPCGAVPVGRGSSRPRSVPCRTTPPRPRAVLAPARHLPAGRTGKIAVTVAGLALALAVGLVYRRAGVRQRLDSLAILPFTNGTGDPALTYLSDGLAESLIQTLRAPRTCASWR